jgi:hypothetical protein
MEAAPGQGEGLIEGRLIVVRMDEVDRSGRLGRMKVPEGARKAGMSR